MLTYACRGRTEHVKNTGTREKMAEEGEKKIWAKGT